MSEVAAALVDWFAAPLQFDFMRRALLVAVVAGAACAVLSCWLTLVGWSLLGDAVSHAVLPGVALAYLLGLPFAVGALAFGAGSVALIGLVNRTSRVKEDAVIGVVFTAMFALGLVLVSAVPSQTDLGHILFGNVLGASMADVFLTAAVGGTVLVVVVALFKELRLWAFDPLTAQVAGLPVRGLHYLLMLLVSATIVASLRAVGIVLALAVLVIPPATAYLLTRRLPQLMAVAAALGTISAVVGLYLSFYLDIASGPAVGVRPGGRGAGCRQ
jgi:manganese transport system permease protein